MTTARRTALLAAALALSACGSTTDFADPTAWEAFLTGTGFPPSEITGSVGALSQGRNTQISISISDAQPGAVHAWQLRTGDCETDGERVGTSAAYPSLTVSSQGSADADAVLSRTLDEDEDYQVVVLQSPTVDDVIACGNLDLAEF